MPINRRTLVVKSPPNPKPVPSKNSAISNLANAFGLEPDDDLKMTISDGFVSAHVKKKSGQVISHKINVDSEFRQMTVVGSGNAGPENRRKIVKSLRKEGKSQTAIAYILGVSQATISLDLKALGLK